MTQRNIEDCKIVIEKDWEHIPAREYPHFELVPVSPSENEEYRERILENADKHEHFQDKLIKMCSEDSLFWASAFCKMFEPRPLPKTFNFFPWPHQVPVWKGFERFLGHCDMGLEKSRGEGASWMAVLIITHKFLYVPQFAAGMISKDEASCIALDNPDSLFWKINWTIQQLPVWMQPNMRYVAKDKTFKNLDNGATVTGFAATPNAGTGGRKTVFVLDELGKFPRDGSPPADRAVMTSIHHVTDCRWMISTPYGPEGAYYDAMHEKDSNLQKFKLHWSMNPSRTVGAYRVMINRDGSREIVLLDKSYWLKRMQDKSNYKATWDDCLDEAKRIEREDAENGFHYKFFLKGDYVKHERLRSLWYDLQCRRAGATPKSIAQELDLDYGGSSSRFFDITMLEQEQRTISCEPMETGEMLFNTSADNYSDLRKSRFQRLGSGRLHLFFHPDDFGMVPSQRNYVIGADVAAGTGGIASSNSSATVLDRETGAQMAVFTAPDLMPTEFADYCVSLCHWFTGRNGPAILGWEANGPPGQQFTTRIIQLQYPFVYHRETDLESDINKISKSKLGWWSTTKSKASLLGEMSRAWGVGELQIRCWHTLEEAKFYMNMAGGKIEHIASVNEMDPSGAGERHGDRVIGAAIAWWIAKEYRNSLESGAAEPSDKSFLGRRRRHERETIQEINPNWKPKSQRRRQATGRNVFRGQRKRF